MENTIENRLNFFGANLGSYLWNAKWGEEIDFDTKLISVELEQDLYNIWYKNNGSKIIAHAEDWCVIKKPLSSISDVDAIEQALFAIKIGEKIEIDVNDTKKLCELGKWRSIDCLEQLPYQEIDFLRSKGYALLFHDLSVSDLENYGWIKLIK